MIHRFEMAGPHWQLLTGSPLGRLELAPLNSDLGRYFGTGEGVLVISAPKDSALGLRGGDVVLRVDGREPSGPSHLMRILRSYDTGETFKMDIMRDRKRQTVTARIGEHES
jgi:S1-C subfamily serine protease